MNPRASVLAAAAVCALALAPAAGAASAEAAAPTAKPHIATVNGRKVGAEEFERLLNATLRAKFYHKAPPEGQMESVRREVADMLVDRALVLAEADRRGLEADEAEIRKVLEGYERQYGASPNWKSMRERVLPELKRELANQQRLAKIENEVRAVGEPEEAAVRAFYDKNPQLFTEPEQVKLSVIMLKVDPSSPKSVRDKAREEGRDIHARLEKGADFAELAKIHSADPSAAKGGELGYLHRGMLGEQLHEALDRVKAGGYTDSLDVLEGVAIFKLHERKVSAVREFSSVKVRARELLQRERAEGAWKDFVARLRRDAVIEMEPSWAAADAKRAP